MQNYAMEHPHLCPKCGNPIYDCECDYPIILLAVRDDKDRNKFIYLHDKSKYKKWIKTKCQMCKSLVAYHT